MTCLGCTRITGQPLILFGPVTSKSPELNFLSRMRTVPGLRLARSLGMRAQYFCDILRLLAFFASFDPSLAALFDFGAATILYKFFELENFVSKKNTEFKNR